MIIKLERIRSINTLKFAFGLEYLYSWWIVFPGPGPDHHCYCSVLQTWPATWSTDVICHVINIKSEDGKTFQYTSKAADKTQCIK